MDDNAVYERDLLYPTESMFEPGSIHLEILNPTKSGRMHVLIECKTAHSPIENIDSIIQVMQSDIFDRIHIDLKSNVDLYIKTNGLKGEFNGKKYICVIFNDGKIEYKGINEINQ